MLKQKKFFDKIRTKKIKIILKSRNLAFLDVVDEAWIITNSSQDSKIIRYKADNESFLRMNYSNLKLIIANSLNAFDVLKETATTCPSLKNFFDRGKVIVLPQQIRGYSKKNLQRGEKPINKTNEISTATEQLKDAWKNYKSR